MSFSVYGQLADGRFDSMSWGGEIFRRPFVMEVKHLDSFLGFLFTLVLITGGLALIAARWKSWRPVLRVWLQVLKVSAIGVLYAMYYLTYGVVRLIRAIGKARLGKGVHDVSARDREQHRPPR